MADHNYYAKKRLDLSSVCQSCRPLIQDTKRKFFPKFDETKVALNNGIQLSLTSDTMMFNLTDFYKNNYKPSSLSNIALRTFMLTPIFQGILSILRKESYEALSLIKKDIGPEICNHHADVYIHIGFLALVLIDLRVLTETENAIWLLHQEIRNLISSHVASKYNPKNRIIFPIEELMKAVSYAEILECSKIADKIILNTQGQINPTPWISIDCPVLTAPKYSCTDPMTQDIVSILNGSLHVIYITIDILLAKRFNLLPHCKALGIEEEDTETKTSPIMSFPWSPNTEGSITRVIE